MSALPRVSNRAAASASPLVRDTAAKQARSEASAAPARQRQTNMAPNGALSAIRRVLKILVSAVRFCLWAFPFRSARTRPQTPPGLRPLRASGGPQPGFVRVEWLRDQTQAGASPSVLWGRSGCGPSAQRTRTARTARGTPQDLLAPWIGATRRAVTGPASRSRRSEPRTPGRPRRSPRSTRLLPGVAAHPALPARPRGSR